MTAAWAAFRLQMRLAVRTPNLWMVQLTTPAQVILFLSVVRAFNRPDLLAAAVIAPTLITLWATAVWTGGSVIRDDRWQGRLELHAAAPVSYETVVPARVAAVMTLSLSAVPLALLTAWAAYGVSIEVKSPLVLAAALLLTVTGITGAAAMITSMTVLSRAANTLQSSASYPFLLLGGVFVPLALLPAWVQPIGRVVFLSWGSDLIRDGIAQPAVQHLPARMLALGVLATAGFFAAHGLLRLVMRRVRVSGEISTL